MPLQGVPAHIMRAAEKAQEAVSLREPYEQAIGPGKELDAGARSLARWQSFQSAEVLDCDFYRGALPSQQRI